MSRFYSLAMMFIAAIAWGQDGSQHNPNPNPNNPNEITQQDVITGKMFIKFNTRTQFDESKQLRDGSPAMGARDAYFFTIDVLHRVEFDGKIARQPNLFNRKNERVQPALFDFEKLDINVINPNDPTQKKSIGRWTGLAPIDTNTGAYKLAGGGDRGLRIFIEPIGRAMAINENFDGTIFGKADDKSGLVGQTYKRLTGKDSFVEYTAKKIDPIRFENVTLATGPVVNYPRCTVNGRLDYDYDTGNYLVGTDGIQFSYNFDGHTVNDMMTGSIKWIDPKGQEKGYYEFNLRFNEQKTQAQGGQGVDSAFAQGEGLAAFFSTNENVPSLTGRITYTDKNQDNGNGTSVTVESNLEYHIHGNKLTEQQLMNFIKLWILIVGPTNDE